MSPQGYLDTLGMWAATAALPERVSEALESTRRALAGARLPEGSAIGSVAIFGLGTDALAGHAAAAIAAPHSPVPVWVGHGPDVPAFVDERTLVLAVSCGPGTFETMRATHGAVARRAPVVVFAGGAGEPLAALAAEAGLVHCPVAEGEPRGRAALGATTVSLLTTLAAAGLVPDCADSVSSAAASLARRRDAFALDGSPPEVVARRIGRTIPLVYGSDGATGVAARRWKAAINLNAKAPAFCSSLPGVASDELAGWGQGGDVTRQIMSLVLLRDESEDARTVGLFDAVVRATDEVMADVVEVPAEGVDALGRFLDLVLFGDFVSLHLAGPEGVDPGPAPAVEEAEAGRA